MVFIISDCSLQFGRCSLANKTDGQPWSGPAATGNFVQQRIFSFLFTILLWSTRLHWKLRWGFRMVSRIPVPLSIRVIHILVFVPKSQDKIPLGSIHQVETNLFQWKLYLSNPSEYHLTHFVYRNTLLCSPIFDGEVKFRTGLIAIRWILNQCFRS